MILGCVDLAHCLVPDGPTASVDSFGAGGRAVPWEQLIAELVRRAAARQAPTESTLHPPAAEGWPKELPAGGTLPRFYAVCDGGVLPEGGGWAEFFPAAELAERTRELAERLASELAAEERTSPLVLGQHLVFGGIRDRRPFWLWDMLWLWDAATDRLVGYMRYHDHDWYDEGYPNLDAFFTDFFADSPHRYSVHRPGGWAGLLTDR